jgi:hypothetical protein
MERQPTLNIKVDKREQIGYFSRIRDLQARLIYIEECISEELLTAA